MASGTIKAICIGAVAGELMQAVRSVEAIAGQGLNGIATHAVKVASTGGGKGRGK